MVTTSIAPVPMAVSSLPASRTVRDSAGESPPADISSTLSELFPEPQAALLPFYSELICAEGISEKVFALRFEALQTLQGCLNHYRKLGYMPSLLQRIAQRKAALIMAALSKTEIERIINPRAPRFDGIRFIPDPYMVPEEELICWSETSLRAPLNEAGYRRYMTLFRQIFPKGSEVLSIA